MNNTEPYLRKISFTPINAHKAYSYNTLATQVAIEVAAHFSETRIVLRK